MTACLRRGDQPVHLEVALGRLARRTASASCRSGSPPPGRRSRTAGPRRRAPAGRRARRAAARPRDPRGTATSNASASAPPVRISHSSRSARSCSVTPGPDLGQQRRERPIRDRARGGDALELVGRLGRAARASSHGPRPGRARRRAPQPRGAATGRAARRRPRARRAGRPTRASEAGPRVGERVADLVDRGVGCLATSLDGVPASR